MPCMSRLMAHTHPLNQQHQSSIVAHAGKEEGREGVRAVQGSMVIQSFMQIYAIIVVSLECLCRTGLVVLKKGNNYCNSRVVQFSLRHIMTVDSRKEMITLFYFEDC